MKTAFRYAAVLLAASSASGVKAGQTDSVHTIAIVVGATDYPQTYMPSPYSSPVFAESDGGYAFNTYWCHKPKQLFANRVTAFKHVQQFCAANAKAEARRDTIAQAVEAQLKKDLAQLADEEKRDLAERTKDFEAYIKNPDDADFTIETAADWDEFARTTDCHVYVGTMASKMARARVEQVIDAADISFKHDLNDRFARMFPYGVKIIAAPNYSSASALSPRP